MSLTLDHIIITVADLDIAMRDYQALGFTVARGGVHANRATENALIVFEDGTYLELLARTGDAPLPNLVDFSAVFANGMGLAGYALRTDDLAAEKARLEAQYIVVGDIIPGERQRADGKVVQWKLARVNDSFAPFLIEDVTPRDWRIPTDPALTTHANHAVGLGGVEIFAANLKEYRQWLVRLIGAPRNETTLVQIGPIHLALPLLSVSEYASEEIPDDFKLFDVRVEHEELEAANPSLEPQIFRSELKSQELQRQKRLARWRQRIEEDRAKATLIGQNGVVLSAVQLIREDDYDSSFTLDRTHGVRFRQIIGIPPQRGEELIPFLDQVKWHEMGWLSSKQSQIMRLLRCLTSSSLPVRRDAYSKLREILFPEIPFEMIPVLLHLLGAPSVHDKSAIIGLISTIMDLEAPRYGSEYQRAPLSIAQPHLREGLNIILQLLGDPDSYLRFKAATELLVFLDTPNDIALIAPLLKTRIMTDNNVFVRAECVRVLGSLYSHSRSSKLAADEVSFFASLQNDLSQSLGVRFWAVNLLVWQDAVAYRHRAMTILNDIVDGDPVMWKDYPDQLLSQDGVLWYAQSMLGNAQAIEWITVQSTHASADVRREACRVLRDIMQFNADFTPQIIPVIRRLLHDPSPDVRLSALWCFSYPTDVDNDVSVELQNIAAQDPSLTIRIAANKVLAQRPPESE